MPSSTSEQFQFNESKQLSYKLTTTTTDGNGDITGISVFRSVYPPTTTVNDLPASIQSAASTEWTTAVKSRWSDQLAAIQPAASAQA